MDRFTTDGRARRLGRACAVFMNALVDDGFVVLGGPIGDGTRHRARLIVKSTTEQEVRERLARDPWAQMGLLVTESRSGKYCWATSPMVDGLPATIRPSIGLNPLKSGDA